MTTFYFGERWDAPMLDENAEQVPAPVGQACLDCTELIVDGDRGVLRGYARKVDGVYHASVEPIHAECALREALGGLAHMEGRCRCCTGVDAEPYPGTAREEALAVVALVNEQRASQGSARFGPLPLAND